MKTHCNKLLARCLAILWGTAAQVAGADSRAPNEQPLFEDQSVLDITLPIDFPSLCRPRETPDCGFAPAELRYEGEDGSEIRIPVEVRIRGGWRSLKKNCTVPPLFIRFDEEHTAGTLFAGQSMLPLTTHCGRGLALWHQHSTLPPGVFEQYLLKEYLGYRMFNDITVNSLRVRLVQIAYNDPGGNHGSYSNYAFFAEHFKSAASRLKRRLLPRGAFDHEKLDTESADILALYQFMIGNTDWSIVRQRNLILLESDDGGQLPIPYDFDMSGLVAAHYAGPAAELPIETISERYYLGFCSPDQDWDTLFSLFLDRQQQLMSLADSTPGLHKKELRFVRRFLQTFFNILNSPDKRKNQIIKACQPWPPSPVDRTASTRNG